MGEAAHAGPSSDLKAFLAPLGSLVRRAESRDALEYYVRGLLAELPRKTASDMARAFPETSGQRLQEFLTRTAWDTGAMDRMRIGEMVRHATVGEGVLVIGETLIPKKGVHSVGVARQALSTGGPEEHGQLLVTAHYVDDGFDWPVAARLYLPESWAEDAERRQRAQVPEELEYQPHDQVALRLLDEALAGGVEARVVLGHSASAGLSPLAVGLAARRQRFLLELTRLGQLRLAGDDVPAAVAWRQAQGGSEGVEASHEAHLRWLAERVPAGEWQVVVGREPGGVPRVRQYARLRAHWSGIGGWLLLERPVPGYQGSLGACFAGGLDEVSVRALARLAQQRRTADAFLERARYELGLADYEGRLWTGFHRHVALVLLAFCYRLLLQAYGPEIQPLPAARLPRRRARSAAR